MAKQYVVKLTGAKLWTSPAAGGKLKWRQLQERPMLEGDPRLAYYDGKRAFEVFEKVPPKKPVAPSLRPKKAKPAPKPAKVAAAPDLGAEEAPPLAEPAPEIDDEGPPGPSIPADEELAEWLKKPLVELAVEYGLDVSGMTKPEIRAAIDKIR